MAEKNNRAVAGVDVSIIVVAWNVGAYIAKALESCLWQGHRAVEIVVIENGSTDNTAAEIDRVAAGDPRVRVLRNDSNTGLGPARNQGMAVAAGEYVMFLDGDDWLEPNAAGLAFATAKKHDADVVLFDHARVQTDSWTYRDCNRRYLLQGVCQTMQQRQLAIKAFGTVWNKIYRRAFLERERLQFANSYYEDIDWTYPVYMLAPTLVTLPETLINYRLRDGSILRSYSPRHFEVLDRWHSVTDFVDRNRHRIDPAWPAIIAATMARQLDSMVKSPFAGSFSQRLEFAKRCQPLLRHMDPQCKLKFGFFRNLRYKFLWHGWPSLAIGLMAYDIAKAK